LAALTSLRPLQRWRSFTWHFPAAALVGIAAKEDIHVLVKTSSVLLSVFVHQLDNNIGFTRFGQSVCFTVSSLNWIGELHAFNRRGRNLIFGQGCYRADKTNFDAVHFNDLRGIQ